MIGGLVKEQFGVVFDFGYNDLSITKVYVKLNDKNGGNEAKSKDLYVTKHEFVTIQSIDLNIIISKIHLKLSKELNFH